MFTGLSRDLCESAWNLIKPAVTAAIDSGTFNKSVAGLAVLNPADPAGPPLFSATIGAGAQFVDYAADKARLALRTGIDTEQLRTLAPHLYRDGDIKWPGGVVRDGVALGFSGVQGIYDQMVCEWFIAALRAQARFAFESPTTGADAAPTPYLGREA